VTGAVATSRETLDWLLEKSKRRDSFPIHKTFLQVRQGKGLHPGPLAEFVRSQRERALDLYMLALTLATGAPHNVAQPAGVWARALGIGSSKTAAAAISKQWRWLEDHRLIRRSGRRGSFAEIMMLREDGSGGEYVAGLRGGLWIPVPLAYWTGNWHGKLNLPGKAVLLIALSLLDDFYLPQEKGPEWYGLSPDTVGRGLVTLKRHGLLTERVLQKPAANAPHGYTRQHYYTLREPFGPKGKRSGSLQRATVVTAPWR
jgi:hypothetical protein